MADDKINILYFSGDRSDYQIILPVMKLLPGRLVACHDVPCDKRIYLAGDIQAQVAKVISERFEADYLYVVGDRYEAFAAAAAAFFQRVPIAHEGGGAITQGGCFDDQLRHAITKLAHLHFVSCQEHYDNLIKLGEEPWRITVSGSTLPDREIGEPEPCDILFTQHAIPGQDARAQIVESLSALAELNLPTIITYPNPDPGREAILDEFKNWRHVKHFRFIPNLGNRYTATVKNAKVVVGNSSSGLIKTAFFGVPCVNIGDRQKGRVRAGNVIDVPHDREKIKQAVLEALEMERVCSDKFRGGGAAAIVKKLKEHLGDKRLLRKGIN